MHEPKEHKTKKSKFNCVEYPGKKDVYDILAPIVCAEVNKVHGKDIVMVKVKDMNTKK